MLHIRDLSILKKFKNHFGFLIACFILLRSNLLYANSGTTRLDCLIIINYINDVGSWYKLNYINFKIRILPPFRSLPWPKCISQLSTKNSILPQPARNYYTLATPRQNFKLDPQWVTGFTDGEWCFTVVIVKKKYKLG